MYPILTMTVGRENLGATLLLAVVSAWVLRRTADRFVVVVGVIGFALLHGAVGAPAGTCLALIAALAGVLVLHRYVRDGEHGWLILGGALLGLPTAMGTVTTVAAVVVGLVTAVLLGTKAWPDRRRLVGEWACLSVGGAVGVGLGGLWWWSAGGQAVDWRVVAAMDIPHLAEGIWWQALVLVVVVAPSMPWQRRNEGPAAVVVGLLVVVVLGALWRDGVPWAELAAGLPAYGAGAVLVAGILWWRQRQRALVDSRLFLFLLLGVPGFLLPALTPVRLALLPAALLLVAVWLFWVPRWLGRRGGSPLVARAAALAALMFAAIRYLAAMPR